MRRNSGPESGRRKSCSILQSRFADISSSGGNNSDELKLFDSSKMKKRKGHKPDDKQKLKGLDEKKYFRSSKRNDSSSSDDSDYNRRGQSLDRSIAKHQKKTLCFQRDRESKTPDSKKDYKFIGNRRDSSVDSLMMHHATGKYADYGSNDNSPRNSRPRGRFNEHSLHHQQHYATISGSSQYSMSLDIQKDLNDFSGSCSANQYSDDVKPKESSRFQIGKRLLKGEIGIKSFNYYLLKEGLKSSKKSAQNKRSIPPTEPIKPMLGISKSEENIYEEIYFVDRRQKKQMSYPDCELCIQECNNKNCDICKANELKMDVSSDHLNIIQSKDHTPLYATTGNVDDDGSGNTGLTTQTEHASTYEETLQNVLQYHSYNPNNPGVYKIETTPVAFTSDYNPIQNINQQIQFQPYTVNSFNPYTVNRKKSSSSSDSLHQKNTRRAQSEYFACPPKTAIYPNQPPDYIKPKIYKTDSRASLASEISIKSENSVKYHKTGEMSDSSIGDSMFSYPTQRRYFGSSESCRFGFECRRCSLETDKCSFSDTCRYECKNCDCSSSYFSSDFDDTNFNRKNSTNHTTRLDARTTRYAEDFIKHVNNVKKNTLYHINKSYEEFPTTHKNLKHQKLVENSTKSPLKLNQDEKSLEENENLKLFSTENKETLLNRKKNKRTGTVPKSIVNDKLFIVKKELENVEGNSTGKINFIEQTELDVKVNCNLSENKILKVTNKLLEKKKISDWSDDEVFFDDLVLDAVTVKKVVSFFFVLVIY